MKDIVLCSDEGLAVRIGDGPVMSLPWSDVRRVHAHRSDLGASQRLIVAVEDETGHAVELNPSMEGWDEFIAHIAERAGRTPADLHSSLEALAITDETMTLIAPA